MTTLLTMAKQLKQSAFSVDVRPSLTTLFHDLGFPGAAAVVASRLSCRAQAEVKSESLFLLLCSEMCNSGVLVHCDVV